MSNRMNDDDETQYSNNQNNTRRNTTRSMLRPTFLTEPDSFLYRNRWWVVLGLALLLMYYLHSRSCMEHSSPDVIELNIGMMNGGKPRNVSLLDLLPKYSPAFNTEHRKLFGL
jgi:hypothetical protein